ncbi:MAG: 1-(5-phosphoribosyl)-5-[(5-phosphoribosylamino)methylideneamino]imidazole-4-carboxamide isomerase [Caldicoprobacter oshimai]|uniref:1-(5-phosphoribosyl)-5-[(5-phosphoribosylamino)methylideneamino] imidazole-4-carboxamide isomerase n=1 Tax=Caldicoprobacter faecalis TaxID=937334 RepID=A0A1I5RVB4_9FIRM|nr:1-(5-phosphoribosyl)-5-[(5-phosphoribosylamino)methylideneamino]imidazole-4-carboxamide isomerase [Caldicoprobacter faecalis]PZN12182.1 MAG: 1-(5-phosphoribosyl)-5-[(5-phosphoribosylamino)methylideneamino]imidazole-4-carboxamide isomerase [Caldicoprobacter oshimai]SFP62539.1 1-(5-phosphoribosyl)-5-[(5-phosphoribosylamino)methylideneamino] imidazole-4-carboxamide isomerase [Caldicoprobacter faecalis]
MTIYPAIDIKGGKCVRLIQGRAEHQTVYSDNPVEVALQWKAQGARFLHVVDLDGAFQGHSQNESIIKEIIERVNIPVQVGGGIRSMERIAYLLEEVGVARVILGTAAVEDPVLLERAIRRFGTSIAVGIDARNNRVAIRGWVEECDITPVELGKRVKEMGVETAIYTDILRDGMLEGPNIPSTREMVEKTGLNVIASGGVSSLEHIAQLKSVGVDGVIIGKALYSGKIDLKQALKLEER